MPRALPRSFARALCAATLCSLAPVAIAAGLPADLGERLARDYARPAMARMAQASEQMDAALGAWCARPDAAGATRVNDAHTGLALAWSGIEFLRFGPLVQANRYERLAFWPDTRGVMPRQVQAAIAAQDPELIKPGAMAGRSVALQGLPALEYVLYGEPALLKRADGADFAYACGYARRCPPTCPASRANWRRPGAPKAISAASSPRPGPPMTCTAIRRKWRPRPSRRCPPACSSRAT